ncbi:MAG TPA: bis(5'-nucleosyl)-tetraphosphatase (symmetrical) YqeK [Clostridia bacterium]|nr:bis(5'-nucleosyl)-tetraphosphatase (symmetrical) YqeK [Clostridia bacterium]
MMQIDDIKVKLKQMLTPQRFAHSVQVMEASVKLAGKYGEDPEKAAIAGLVHDCAKDLPIETTFTFCDKYGIIIDDIMKCQPELLHGLVGSYLARDIFGIECPRILAAVEAHTMGREGMDKLCSIVFIADYIEAGRNYPGVEKIRAAAEESLEKAVVAGIDNTVTHILKKGGLLHPQTVATRNWALKQSGMVK